MFNDGRTIHVKVMAYRGHGPFPISIELADDGVRPGRGITAVLTCEDADRLRAALAGAIAFLRDSNGFIAEL